LYSLPDSSELYHQARALASKVYHVVAKPTLVLAECLYNWKWKCNKSREMRRRMVYGTSFLASV
jgi:hypothetical protein